MSSSRGSLNSLPSWLRQLPWGFEPPTSQFIVLTTRSHALKALSMSIDLNLNEYISGKTHKIWSYQNNSVATFYVRHLLLMFAQPDGTISFFSFLDRVSQALFCIHLL